MMMKIDVMVMTRMIKNDAHCDDTDCHNDDCDGDIRLETMVMMMTGDGSDGNHVGYGDDDDDDDDSFEDNDL